MSRGAFLFNAGPFYVGVRPGIQLLAIKADALDSNAELPNIGPDSVVEFGAAHAEVGRGRAGSKDSGWAGDQACDYLFR